MKSLDGETEEDPLKDLLLPAYELRTMDREEFMKLSPEERVRWAFEEGERELDFIQEAFGVDRRMARRIIERRHQAGRTFSKCITEIIG